MVRTVITPQQQDVSINLPQDYIGKKVEVIAFTIEEVSPSYTEVDNLKTHLVSEKVLAKDWLTPEEDAAWEQL